MSLIRLRPVDERVMVLSTASLTKPLKSRGVPKGNTIIRPEAGTAHALGFLLADARQRGAGANVERLQPQARTTDVAAGDERRRIGSGTLVQDLLARGWGHRSDHHQ